MNTENKTSQKLFFVHIGKTAGVSFEHILKDNYRSSRICPCYYDTDFIDSASQSYKYDLFIGHNWYYTKSILPPVGITTFVREPIERVLSAYEHILRDKNHYYHEIIVQNTKNPRDFIDHNHIKRTMSNAQTRILGLQYDMNDLITRYLKGQIDRKNAHREVKKLRLHSQANPAMLAKAKERLSKMKAFGITERFNASVQWIGRVFGLQIDEVPKLNTSPNKKGNHRQNYDREDIKVLEKLNEYDLELYRYAKQLQEERMNNV